MSEADAAATVETEMPTDAGGAPSGGGGFDLGSYTEAIDDVLDGWYAREGERRQALADDPCRFAVDAQQQLTDTWMGQLNTAAQNAAKLSDAGARAVYQARDNWGRPSPHYGGVEPFASFLINNNVVPPFPDAIAAGLLTGNPTAGLLVQLTKVNERLPSGPPPQGTKTGSNKGFQFGPGVWLYAAGTTDQNTHALQGKLRGSEIVAAYQAWMNHVRSDSYPAAFPGWRNRLVQLAGRSRSDWTIWRQGDPLSPTSKVGQLAARNDEVRRWIADARQRCIDASQPAPPPAAVAPATPWGPLLLLGLLLAAMKKKKR